jgi:multidrug resistance protein
MADLESGPTFDSKIKDEDALESPVSLSESYSNEEKKNDDANPPEKQAQSMIVDWDGPDDPEFPQNFPRWRKFVITISSATLTLTFTFSSSIMTAATVPLAEEFNVSTEVMILATSLFVLGFGMGPTLFGPLSELYGRKIPLLTGFFIFAIFQIPVAVATDLQSIMIFRFLQGFFGSSPTATLGGALADFWNPRERGFAMPSFAGALFAGPIFGPIVGAFVTQSFLGWRWTQWITLIMACFFGILNFFVFPETYAPVLLARRAKKLRYETGNWALHAKHEERKVDLKDIAHRYLTRPAKMFVMEPILALLTLYLSFVFGEFFRKYVCEMHELTV